MFGWQLTLTADFGVERVNNAVLGWNVGDEEEEKRDNIRIKEG